MRAKHFYAIGFWVLGIIHCFGQKLTLEQRINAETVMEKVRVTTDPSTIIELTGELLSNDSSNTYALAYRALANHWAKDYEAALRDFNLFMKKHPRSDFIIYRAKLKMEMGDTAGAKKDIASVMAISAYNLNNCKTIEHLFGIDFTAVHFEEMLKINPDNYVANYIVGIQKDKKGDIVAAAQKYTKAVNLLNSQLFSDGYEDNRYETRWLFWLKSHADFKLKHYSEAIDAVTQSILLFPEDPSYYKDRIKYYLAMQQREKACIDLNQFKTLGQNYQSYQVVLQCNFSDPSCEPSREWLETVEAEKLYILGHKNVRTETKTAFDFYTKALQIKPNHIYALAGKALCFSIFDQPDKVITELDKVIKIDPKSASALDFRAGSKKDVGLFKEALTDANEAVRISPMEPRYLVTRASIQTILLDTVNALADLSKAIELDKYYILAYFERAVLNGEKENYKEALTDYLRAIEIGEGVPFNHIYPTYYYNCSFAYDHLMLYREALEMIEKAIAIRPDSGKYYYRCGEIKARMKDMEGACREWNTAKKLGYKEAENVLFYNCQPEKR